MVPLHIRWSAIFGKPYIRGSPSWCGHTMGGAMKSYVLHTIGGAKFYKEAQQCERPHGGQDAPTIGGAQGEPLIYLPPPTAHKVATLLTVVGCASPPNMARFSKAG